MLLINCQFVIHVNAFCYLPPLEEAQELMHILHNSLSAKQSSKTS